MMRLAPGWVSATAHTPSVAGDRRHALSRSGGPFAHSYPQRLVVGVEDGGHNLTFTCLILEHCYRDGGSIRQGGVPDPLCPDVIVGYQEQSRPSGLPFPWPGSHNSSANASAIRWAVVGFVSGSRLSIAGRSWLTTRF